MTQSPATASGIYLPKGFYFKDKRDVDLISSIVEKQYLLHPGATDNVGELNKAKYNVNADEAFAKGGRVV
jgi:hypothetical protein